MKKASMACLIAGALALPLAHAQEDKSNTTDPMIGKTPGTGINSSPMNRDTAPMNRDATPSRGASATMSDAAITAKVKTQLIKDHDVSAMNVNVDTASGVVTLKGHAKSRMESDKAASLARSVEGVKSVKNELVVGMADSNTSKGSSTGTGASTGNAKNALDNKPSVGKESKGERGNSEKTN